MKQQRLVDHYSIHEISVGMSRLLNMTEAVIRNNPYNVEEISARLSLDKNLVRNILSILCDQGIWKYSAKTDYYFVPGELK